MTPFVSVITPTWTTERHRVLLDRCIPSVQAQGIALEHIVVSDGPDPELAELMTAQPILYRELDEHDTDRNNFGSRARNHGLAAASGEYIAYLDSDNAYRPNHLSALVAQLDRLPEIDFAYSRMFRHPINDEVGSAPPALGCLDTSLIVHRREVADRLGMWPVPGRIYHCPDWELIADWLAAGAKWIFVPEVTVDYYFPAERLAGLV